MNTKSRIINQTIRDKSPSFVVEKNEAVNASVKVAMSDIATKLHSVSAQMQMKHSLSAQTQTKHSSRRSLASQDFMDNGLKSYLDDISRAILAEHYMRRQEEKKCFEHLEQIKILVQGLHNEKKNQQETTITQNIFRTKSPASVVHHLAHMACKERKIPSSHQKVQNFSKQNSVNIIQENTVKALQKDRQSLSLTDAVKPSLKRVYRPVAERIDRPVAHSIVKENHSNTQASCGFIKGDQYTPSLKTEFLGIFSFLRYFDFVKKFLTYFLIIASIAGITLFFYRFLQKSHFFDFMMFLLN
ncbi:hypothetical protein V4P56_04190 [Bartonella sp. B35(2025)]